MKIGGGFLSFFIQFMMFLILGLYVSSYASPSHREGFGVMDKVNNQVAPDISPSAEPHPFLPNLAPSPLTPFTNKRVPRLSGKCTLNFSAAESAMKMTATDCWTSFAPYLANVVCCPQFHATLAILMGQSSIYSGVLALNTTQARHCLSDVEKILEAQGSSQSLHHICSIQPESLVDTSCPIIEVDELESSVDTSRLLTACEKVDPVNECCNQRCQNAILEAARKIALNGISTSDGVHVSPEHLTRIDACKSIALRWLASKLDPFSANKVLRGLSNCNVNKVCPLVFPNMTNIVKKCGGMVHNQTACCEAMEKYVSQLQKQSFITNLQAFNCAASLGMELQKVNVTHNLYDVCHINLKDFSLQVGSQESGCLLPSIPSDATFDRFSGISFICDLNDNIAAPWPSASFSSPSSCNKTTKLPALPTATSAQNGIYLENLILPLLLASLLVFGMLR